MRASFASSSASSTRSTGPSGGVHPALTRSRLLPTVCLSLVALIRPVALDAEPLADRFVVSPTVSIPLAVGSTHRDQIGLDVGLSVSAPTGNSYLGVGMDASYHYWPVSGEFKQAFNDHLRSQTLQTLMLGGGIWGLRVTQLGVHLRVASHAPRGAWPWLRIGAGAYRVDPYTEGYSGDAGFFSVVAPPLKRTNHMGWSVAVGTDAIGGPRARMGLDATYHFVGCSETYAKNLQVFALGVHALFGW